jgi:hypothetical protein
VQLPRRTAAQTCSWLRRSAGCSAHLELCQPPAGVRGVSRRRQAAECGCFLLPGMQLRDLLSQPRRLFLPPQLIPCMRSPSRSLRRQELHNTCCCCANARVHFCGWLCCQQQCSEQRKPSSKAGYAGLPVCKTSHFVAPWFHLWALCASGHCISTNALREKAHAGHKLPALRPQLSFAHSTCGGRFPIPVCGPAQPPAVGRQED